MENKIHGLVSWGYLIVNARYCTVKRKMLAHARPLHVAVKYLELIAKVLSLALQDKIHFGYLKYFLNKCALAILTLIFFSPPLFRLLLAELRQAL